MSWSKDCLRDFNRFSPHLKLLTEQQLRRFMQPHAIVSASRRCLVTKMVKLHQILAEAVAAGRLGEGNYSLPQMGPAIEKLEALVRFVNQADHLRQETLQQMSRILNTHQAAQGLLALGEY
ncbi:TGACG-sequence-specific DNA-binding protein TGA-1A [Datura stramonium]|uniref:TGACG-sequence-specific DNA-binding protein TGA-1A n=1 Tax=Datura stramonium TaxID=4076 RepID=A0ABS8RH05_DATST|nr:TGACG-sequence-specific DNA-binding protein TGA-1A [Datura stramonium]